MIYHYQMNQFYSRSCQKITSSLTFFQTSDPTQVCTLLPLIECLCNRCGHSSWTCLDGIYFISKSRSGTKFSCLFCFIWVDWILTSLLNLGDYIISFRVNMEVQSGTTISLLFSVVFFILSVGKHVDNGREVDWIPLYRCRLECWRIFRRSVSFDR